MVLLFAFFPLLVIKTEYFKHFAKARNLNSLNSVSNLKRFLGANKRPLQCRVFTSSFFLVVGFSGFFSLISQTLASFWARTTNTY